jgi:hypothetical protein
MKLAPDATLKDINLSHPKTYYPPLIKLMEACANAHGSAYMRIGVTGNGSTPYYQISVDEQAAQIIGAFDYGHKFEPKPSQKWSTKTTGILDVVMLAKPHLQA